MKKTGYRQLQPEERVTLASLQQQGYSLRDIAKTLNRSASTLSRELGRNTRVESGHYVAREAQQARDQRRQTGRPWPKLHPELKLWRVVQTCLSWRWSPQQIARTLRRMWPDEPDMPGSYVRRTSAAFSWTDHRLRR